MRSHYIRFAWDVIYPYESHNGIQVTRIGSTGAGYFDI